MFTGENVSELQWRPQPLITILLTTAKREYFDYQKFCLKGRQDLVRHRDQLLRKIEGDPKKITENDVH